MGEKMRWKTNEGNTTPVNIAATTVISVPSEEIPFSSPNYKELNFVTARCIFEMRAWHKLSFDI
jgi:hypothetical protein